MSYSKPSLDLRCNENNFLPQSYELQNAEEEHSIQLTSFPKSFDFFNDNSYFQQSEYISNLNNDYHEIHASLKNEETSKAKRSFPK